MPKEEKKEYLKILGVDNSSSESRYFHGYISNYKPHRTVEVHRNELPTSKWAVESGLFEVFKIICSTDSLIIYLTTLL